MFLPPKKITLFDVIGCARKQQNFYSFQKSICFFFVRSRFEKIEMTFIFFTNSGSFFFWTFIMLMMIIIMIYTSWLMTVDDWHQQTLQYTNNNGTRKDLSILEYRKRDREIRKNTIELNCLIEFLVISFCIIEFHFFLLKWCLTFKKIFFRSLAHSQKTKFYLFFFI